MTTNPFLRWLWLAGATLGVLAATAALSSLAPALPILVRDLQLADLSELRWIAGAFVVAFAVLIVPAAVLGDLIGHARVFVLGALLFTVGSLVAALAPSGGVVLLGRLVQGVGAALIVPQIVGYARARLQGLERALACALFALAYLVGWVLGPVLATQLTAHVTWRATFWLMVPLALLAAGAALPLVFERYLGRLDPPLLIVGLAAVPATFGVVFPLAANSGDWTIWYVLPLVAGCVLLAGCLVVEVFRRGIRAGLGAPLLTFLAFAGAADLGALQLYIQVATGESASSVSLAGLPLAAGALIGAGVAVPVGLWLGMRAATASGAAVMFVGAAAQLALVEGAPDSFGWGAVAFGAALNGIGLGLVLTALARTDGAAAGSPAVAAGLPPGVAGPPLGSAGAPSWVAGPPAGVAGPSPWVPGLPAGAAGPQAAAGLPAGAAGLPPGVAGLPAVIPGAHPGVAGLPPGVAGLPVAPGQQGPAGSGGRRADPAPAALFAMIPVGVAVGSEIGLRMMSDAADLVAGASAPELAGRLRDGVASALIVTVVLLVAAVGVAVFLAPRSES